MAPERSVRPRDAAPLALALLLLPGCATLRERLPEGWVPPGLSLPQLTRQPEFEPSDRPSDLLPPDALRVASTEDRQVSLAWNPVLVGDVAGYVITRSDSPQGPFSTVGRTGSRFGTVFSDLGDGPGTLGDGHTYYYRIHPIDSQLRMSRSHAFASATTQPPPETPSGLQAYSNLPRLVVLTWEPSEHWTVSGYAAFRAPTMAGPFERIADISGRQRAVYEDRVPGDLRVMYYRIAALNRFGGESEMTDVVRAVTKAEPLPPIELSVAERELGRVRLSWTPNVETDLRSYQVWRARADGGAWGEPQQLAEVEASFTAWADEGVGCGEPLRYLLRATDADGLVSDYSIPLELRGQDLGLEIEPLADGGHRLRWDAQRARGWTGARVSQSRRGLPDRLLGELDGAASFDLADLDGSRARFGVTLTRTEPGGEGSAPKTTNAPICEIEYPEPESSLLNPPAASVD